MTWSGSKYLISWTERYSRTQIYVETAAYSADGTWGGNFTLASPSGGMVPGAAVPLPLGSGNIFTLINRGKPGKVWSDIPAYSNLRVYGSLMADLRATAVSDPPASSLVKKSFQVTDTVENIGLGASLPSRTIFLLSTTTDEKDTVQWLQAVRSVPAVPAGATNTGTLQGRHSRLDTRGGLLSPRLRQQRRASARHGHGQ